MNLQAARGDNERAAIIEDRLIDLRPYIESIIEASDSDTFWWLYNELLILDVTDAPDEPKQIKTIKAMRKSILMQYRQRYEEEFVERKIEDKYGIC